MRRGRRAMLVLVAVALCGGATAIAARLSAGENGRIGPVNRIQPTGRLLNPYGKQTQLGNFPTGGALTPDGGFLWTLSAGRGKNDIRIVQVVSKRHCPKGKRGRKCRTKREARVGQVKQVIPMPGLSGGIAMSPDKRTAYVSGVADSEHKDQQVAKDVPGRGGNVIHVFRYDRKKGIATRDGVIELPPPSDAPTPQNFPPTSFENVSWPRDIGVSVDGKTLIVALNLADYAAIVDTDSRKARFVKVGHYPYGAAITRDGKYGLVTSETEGKVTVIDLKKGEKVKDIQVGPHLSHPEGMAVDPRSGRIFVAVTGQDVIAVIDPDKLSVERTLSVDRATGNGTMPTQLSVTRDGCDLLSADSGEDAVAVFALRRSRACDVGIRVKAKHSSGALAATRGVAAARRTKTRKSQAFDLVGRIPVGSYPTAVDATPKHKRLAWVSARGVGVGPNPNGPNPLSPKNNDDDINQFQYLPSFVTGSSGVGKFPSDRGIRKLSPKVDKQLVPTNNESPPSGTPIAPPGPGQKIEHVFYIVKENRTYDQLLGDDARGDADPKLTLFGEKATPNLHALAQRFPLLDHVYANSEASIDGHYWTAAGAVSDYVTKAWHQNYGGRKRPYDFGGYDVSAPPKGYLFQRAEKEGISYFNFGEALAGLSPLPDKDRDNEGTAMAAQILTKSDIALNGGCYESDLSNSSTLSQGKNDVYDSSLPVDAQPGSTSRYTCFAARFTGQVATGTVPSFTYIVLPNDHTEGTSPGRRTPTAQIASNDYGLGQMVDLISHSPVWSKSLILVQEDDSQDGADHVDAHRMPALAISPYAKRGAVVPTRYDQVSFIRTLEIIVGMKPLNLAEALALPLYDALTSDPQNSEPYTAIEPKVSITERNTNATTGARESARLPFDTLDKVPQRTLDRLLWQYVHGPNSEPPPPGPNASGADEAGGQPSAEADREAEVTDAMIRDFRKHPPEPIPGGNKP